MQGTSRPESVSARLQRVATLSKEAPEMVWTTLAHHIDLELLKEAYRLTRKDGAVDVEGQTAKEYKENLEENLLDLLNRFKSGTYKAPPVRRTYVPKGDGKRTRPIGISTFEDKVLQRAVAMVLEAVYEQDFLPGVLRKAIDKWLKAGVMEEGTISHPDIGTPQGGVVSPILMNIYLHEVLDTWFEEEVRPRLFEAACLIRYTDDAVFVFHSKEDAERVLAVLPKRFERFALALHPEKTKLLRFKERSLTLVASIFWALRTIGARHAMVHGW